MRRNSAESDGSGVVRLTLLSSISTVEIATSASLESVVESVSRYEVVVLTDDGLVPQPRWIDGLVDALSVSGSQERPVIVAPRSPSVAGVQRIFLTVGIDINVPEQLRSFAQRWERDHCSIVTQERYVSSRVFACARSDLAHALQSETVDHHYDLDGLQLRCYRSLRSRGPMVVAHGSIVAFDEVVTCEAERKMSQTLETDGQWPLLSACMIAKDEEHCIADAIRSAQALVDEVVLFDTGSQDATVAIAQELGAKVQVIPWRDNFAWARNQALSHCRGKWILWLDADEEVRGDRDELRRYLFEQSDEVETYGIRIRNEVGSGLDTPTYHRAARLFRRSEGAWHGSLHEMIWTRARDRTTTMETTSIIEISHKGYLTEFMVAKNKSTRNLALAERGEEFGSPEERDINAARSYLLGGEFSRAFELARQVTREAGNHAFRVFAYRVAMDALLAGGEVAAMEELLEEYGGLDVPRNNVAFYRARYFQVVGDSESALSEFLKITEMQADEFGLEISPESCTSYVAVCLTELGRFSEAADLLLASIADGRMDFHLDVLLFVLDRSARSYGELCDYIPSSKRSLVYAQLLQIRPQRAEPVVDVMFQADPQSLHCLAVAATVARVLSVEDALKWSIRLRDRGLARSCPLRAIASDAGRPESERSRALALLREYFAESDVESGAGASLSGVS
ncbi:MAG: glycosyltransferase family 2 protein [Acidimicrobiales bacterium]